MKPGYTITLLPSWPSASFGERLALEMISATLWPLQHDERMTVLISLLAARRPTAWSRTRIRSRPSSTAAHATETGVAP